MQKLTSMQRVVKTLSHQEPDRVPFFLLLTLHGAKMLGMSIKEYFSAADNVVEGQLRLNKKYGHDCYYSFYYAAIEIEAWGGEVKFIEDGPPNCGAPIINCLEKVNYIEPPNIIEAKPLLKVLETIKKLKAKKDKPIIGVVMSPFSLPIMQLGFEKYLELIYEHREIFDRLIQLNKIFCINWANAQLRAGATAICYFDPISSTTILPKDIFLETGFKIAQETISQIAGPVVIHMASGRCRNIIKDLQITGAQGVGVSNLEDLKDLKNKKISLIGNLNGIEMRRWSAHDAEIAVKHALARGARGGGFILSDSHGEIPYQVSEEVLLSISQAVYKWGRYPLNWVDDYEA